MKIYPTILEQSIEKVLNNIEGLGGTAKHIQIDMCDGTLVEGKTFVDPSPLFDLNFEQNLTLELDLMVAVPEKYIFQNGHISKIYVLSKAIKSKAHFKMLEQLCAENRIDLGISFSLDTSDREMAVFSSYTNNVQFLTVVPGGQGRKFEPEAFKNALKFAKKNPDHLLQLDGGINTKTLKEYFSYSVIRSINSVVAGSAIFAKNRPDEAYLELQKVIKNIMSEKKVQQKKSSEKLVPIEYSGVIKSAGFFGGAALTEKDQAYKEAFAVAKLLAENGIAVINGGGPGIMKAATKGTHAGGKEVLVVTYSPSYKHKNYEGTDPENDFDFEITTKDYFDRTKIMLQNTDLHIVFIGGTGTLSELGMSWANSRIHEGHHKPIILYGNFWEEIIAALEKYLLLREGEADLVKICTSPEEVLDFIKKYNNEHLN
ncbi:LOG family protein [Candidatus Nomurabacteria bacterium]|uniref:LOG family protein n=1 Tax=candidate division WWE3 bacterium TaxID=2053526 RepID=A0A955E054_UNCKA|nr:LOG family protein [candidate division WWE3 bacterium]MCB9823566.1 LOG family protein [Candidatus Nomurabacteria bacterium]MCB9827361.1 LOG family protein [Candidatus Nomurabacteria bacterium]HXK52764.1 LOG family protein [bacterium]